MTSKKGNKCLPPHLWKVSPICTWKSVGRLYDCQQPHITTKSPTTWLTPHLVAYYLWSSLWGCVWWAAGSSQGQAEKGYRAPQRTPGQTHHSHHHSQPHTGHQQTPAKNCQVKISYTLFFVSCSISSNSIVSCKHQRWVFLQPTALFMHTIHNSGL